MSGNALTIGITGATGFIGSTLVPRLSKNREVRIRCLVRHLPEWQPECGDNVEFQIGDLQSPFDCTDFVREIDTIIHLATAGAPLTAGRSLPRDAALTLTPTLNLLQAAKEHRPAPHIVLASSGGQVYGRSPSMVPWTEACPCSPVSIYGIHKLTSEHYLRLLAEEEGMTSTILRIGNVYGRALPPERFQGFIGVAVHELIHGRPIRLIGGIHNVRDYIHIDDLCTAFDLAITRHNGCETFNIGTGQGTSVDEIISLMEKLLGRKIETLRIASATASASLIPWNILDIGKAKKMGWEPSIDLEEGLSRLLKQYQWP